jgi:hypothetical protein
MHGISFDKILPKEVGYIETRINWKQPLEIREFGLDGPRFESWAKKIHIYYLKDLNFGTSIFIYFNRAPILTRHD